MKKQFSCGQGHHWEVDLDDAGAMACISCPQCGAPAETAAIELSQQRDLASPQLATTQDDWRPSAQMAVGNRIGPYKLVQQLGEGGMGAVYVAEQEHPVKRRVALKLIKAGMDSAQVLRRFEAERQALAIMDHPHIAKVLDAGASESGRPYFVMELVKGVPITKYCDELNLPIRERLALFVPVCQAIQHAHQKGIIHRDIKPSNVLVCMQDGKPISKVIDFGVAKAMHQKLTENSLYTEFGQIVGTLEYMSPEQAELSALDIDTRADIYALGVLLYELLTGSTPLNSKQMRSVAFDELLRVIREVEPPRPSTRLTDAKDTLASLAARRRTEPNRLTKEVRGDLDWIVMKALDKDRTRRYATANDLARDVERHLHDEPVEACPPSAGYRLRKYARRHKARLMAATAVISILFAGTVVSTSLAVWAMRAEAQSRKDAEEARTQAAVAKSVSEFLQKDILGQASPFMQSGLAAEPDADLKVRTALDRAAMTIGERFSGQPLVEASIRRNIAMAYLTLGAPYEARPHMHRASELFERELSDTHPDTVMAMSTLAMIDVNAAMVWEFDDNGDPRPKNEAVVLPEAERLASRALGLSRKNFGASDPATLECLITLGAVYNAQQQFDRAELYWTEALEVSRNTLGSDHPLTLQAMNNRGWLLMRQKKPDVAKPFLVEAVERSRQALGSLNPKRAQYLFSLADVCKALGQLKEEDAARLEAMQINCKVFGDNPDAKHQRPKSVLNTYYANKRVELNNRKAPIHEILVFSNRRLAFYRELLGEEDDDTLDAMLDLAWDYYFQAHDLHNRKKADDAARDNKLGDELCKKVVAACKEKILLGDKETADLLKRAADLQESRGEYAEAEAIWVLVVEAQRTLMLMEDANELDLVRTLSSLGWSRVSQDKNTAAETAAREALEIYDDNFLEEWLVAKVLLATALLGQKKYKEAEPLLLHAAEGYKQRIAAKGADAATILGLQIHQPLQDLAEFYEAAGKPDEATKWRKELAAVEAAQKRAKEKK